MTFKDIKEPSWSACLARIKALLAEAYVLFSRAGFTAEVRARQDVELIDLAQIVAAP